MIGRSPKKEEVIFVPEGIMRQDFKHLMINLNEIPGQLKEQSKFDPKVGIKQGFS